MHAFDWYRYERYFGNRHGVFVVIAGEQTEKDRQEPDNCRINSAYSQGTSCSCLFISIFANPCDKTMLLIRLHKLAKYIFSCKLRAFCSRKQLLLLARPSHCNSVCLSVCHTGGSVENGAR